MTTDGITVALSSTMGDPRREQTWSGTPFNLVKSLEDLGVSVVTIDASLSRKVRMVCKLVHLLGGLRCDTRGGPVARLIAAQGISLINREEDLGDPGLRKAKLSYHPSRLEMKYTLTLRR